MSLSHNTIIENTHTYKYICMCLSSQRQHCHLVTLIVMWCTLDAACLMCWPISDNNHDKTQMSSLIQWKTNLSDRNNSCVWLPLLFAYLARLSFLTGTWVHSAHWSFTRLPLQWLASANHCVSCKDDGWWISETMRREAAWLELVAIEGEVEKNDVCLCNVTKTPVVPLAAGGWDGRRSWDWSSFSVCWLPSCLFFFFFFLKVCRQWKSPSRLCCKMNKSAKCAWKATLQGLRHIKWVLFKKCSVIRLRNISSRVKQEKVVIQS